MLLEITSTIIVKRNKNNWSADYTIFLCPIPCPKKKKDFSQQKRGLKKYQDVKNSKGVPFKTLPLKIPQKQN